ncbi:hypothetical protein [Streptomyces ardesiacus]|uniref:hypothetical protein n=1 Tax=Streptomyces ardesiacus TaxID=285564 RepID=UPI00381E026D
MPLATTDDVVARLGRPVSDAAEAAKIAAFLEDAVGLVTDYCHTDFQQHTAETFDLRIVGGRALLAPGVIPYLVISAVTLHEDDGDRALAPGEWKVWGKYLYFSNAPEFVTATVTASWGYPTVPHTVKAAVCSEVIRWLSVSPGTVMERTGDLQVEYATAAFSPSLSEAAKSMLSKYRSRVGSVSLSTTY